MAKVTIRAMKHASAAWNTTEKEAEMDAKGLWIGRGMTKENYYVFYYNDLIKSTESVVLQHLAELQANLNTTITTAQFETLVANRKTWVERRDNYLPNLD